MLDVFVISVVEVIMKIAQVAPLIEMAGLPLPKTHHASFKFLL